MNVNSYATIALFGALGIVGTLLILNQQSSNPSASEDITHGAQQTLQDLAVFKEPGVTAISESPKDEPANKTWTEFSDSSEPDSPSRLSPIAVPESSPPANSTALAHPNIGSSAGSPQEATNRSRQPATSFQLSQSGTSQAGSEQEIIIEEEILLPGDEKIPLVLVPSSTPVSPALATAMEAIADNYLDNLEQELATQSPSAEAPAGRATPSASSRLANDELRGIVGYQEADRIALDAYIQNQQ